MQKKRAMNNLPEKVRITGVLISYHFICRRKAWLFAKGLAFEQGNELVELGKLISETSYPKEKHEVEIDRTIVMDWVDWHRKVIHEVKKSNQMEEAHVWQVKYYILYLQTKGAEGFTGIINYPKQRKIKRVTLSQSDKTKLEQVLQKLPELINSQMPPPPIKKPFCRSCAYFEFCWI